MYKRQSKYFQKTTFDAQIKAHGADINYNDVYDAYDYAFTMFQLDGGTKKTGNVAGDVYKRQPISWVIIRKRKEVV